jgi:phosphate transport system permease protein
LRAINWSFLTQLPHPVGVPGGGIGNGIVGTIIIIGIATLMAVPIGLLTGIYLALFGRGVIPEALRFLSDVLSGVPSIAIGLFAYAVLVAPLKHFSGFSASFAFMMLMLPLLVRTSEHAIRSVPQTVREGALALGMSNFRATVHIVLPTALPAIITALLLAIARVTGEVAPLLFTAFGSQFWEKNPGNPMPAISLQVFTYAISPYQEWQAQAWGGALLLIVAVFILSLGARLFLRRAMRFET